MNRFQRLYTLLHYSALPLLFARLAWRGRGNRGYWSGWAQRLGEAPDLPAPIGPRLWIHAVSVGETIAIADFVQLALDHHCEVVLTNGTPTGAAETRRRFGDRVHASFAPFDTPRAVARFLDRAQPSAAVFVETELWPNWLSACAARGIPTLLANARLSERSARRYARFPEFARSMLNELSTVAAQHAADGERFVALGLPRERLAITGSIKFDARLTDAQRSAAQELRQRLDSQRRRLVLIGASTHEGEDAPVLDAFAAVLAEQPEACLILVPRHPERFQAVYELAAARFTTARRTSLSEAPADFQVLVGDTMGELPIFYGASDIAFVGGSLIERGGHNPIEPALWGLPTYMGPHYFNFAPIVQQLVSAGGLQIVADARELAEAWRAAPAQLEALRTRGEQGLAVVAQSSGANGRLWECLERLLQQYSSLAR